MKAFLLQLPHYQAVERRNHPPDKAGVVLGGVPLLAAPQHQGMIRGVLEPEWVCSVMPFSGSESGLSGCTAGGSDSAVRRSARQMAQNKWHSR